MVWSVLFLVLLVASFVVLFAYVPFNRWVFQYAGRRIEVRNYGLVETVRVDGVLRAKTRDGGDYLTYATHTVRMNRGTPLRIEVATSTYAMRCVARVGDRLVFDSFGPAVPRPRVDDPRWEAAQTLLTELDQHPTTARSAETLRQVLDEHFTALVEARRLARAHHALGGHALDGTVARHEQTVADALALVRELHAAAHLPRCAQSTETAISSSSLASTPRTSTMRSAERAQLERVSTTAAGNA